ncbi:SpaH/EbpB family LPXTG-anchored major pilin [Psychromicrobium xiongbiense]|uniref:SpaH/EbpB family LPXTG-anchored major pilin n=1 Tax=Psychromicrobium xiongbiense TaxID=3051184 RepID=UPI0025540E10|nr:SpaH/EbpB family LPXTG-anchored major pilin [Psychromicrobium sp. YIM S02556]
MNRTAQLAGRRLLSVAAVLAIGLGGAVAAGTAAQAAAVSGPITAQNGSITIHKQANPGFGGVAQNPDGSQGTGGSPLQGVSFEVCSIAGVDLINGGNAAWDTLNNTIGPAAASVKLTDTSISGKALTCKPAQATDATGTTSFAGLPVGAYLVRETSPGTNPIAQMAAPFVVTVPTPAVGADKGKWLYDVHVYPKNQLSTLPSKNLADQPTNKVVLGSPIGFTISQTVPTLASGQTYTRFRVLDALDPALTPSAAPITVSNSGTALVAADYSAQWMGNTLVASLTATGLAKIKAGDVVTVGFAATSSTNGTYDNTAWVNVNDFTAAGGIPPGTTPPTDPQNPNPPIPPGNPTNVVETRWGAVNLTKVNAANNAPLAGAAFDLFMIDAATCPATLTGGTKVSSYVSDATGKLSVPGLWVGDTRTVNGAKPYDTTTRCYYLVETAAPAGFVLNSTPIGIVVHPGTTADAQATKSIQNPQQLVPGLPLTGSDGLMILTIGGIGLIGVALGTGLVARSRARSKTVA